MSTCLRFRTAVALMAAYIFLFATAKADLIGHGGMVRDISVSADGARVLTASFDYTVRLWDFGT